MSTLFELHSESFGYQESEFILFYDELIANVVIGNFFGTQIPVMISIEIVLERLKIFLDRNYIVQEYIEDFDFAIIQELQRHSDFAELIFGYNLIEINKILPGNFVYFAKHLYLDNLFFFHFFYY